MMSNIIVPTTLTDEQLIAYSEAPLSEFPPINNIVLGHYKSKEEAEATVSRYIERGIQPETLTYYSGIRVTECNGYYTVILKSAQSVATPHENKYASVITDESGCKSISRNEIMRFYTKKSWEESPITYNIDSRTGDCIFSLQTTTE